MSPLKTSANTFGKCTVFQKNIDAEIGFKLAHLRVFIL